MPSKNVMEKTILDGAYKVTSDGLLYKRAANDWTLVKGSINNKGYVVVGLSLYGKSIAVLLHRLIAQTFIPNTDNSRDVHHKDGDRTNNCVENLQWLSHAQNVTEAYKRTPRQKTPRKKPDKIRYEKYRKLIDERKLTTAEVCRGTGIAESAMAMWKKRGGSLGLDNMVKLATFFGVPITYFMDVEEEGV